MVHRRLIGTAFSLSTVAWSPAFGVVHQRALVGHRLRVALLRDLALAQIGQEPLGGPGRRLDADEAPPGVRHEVDAILVEPRPQVVRDADHVVDHLVGGHRGVVQSRAVGHAGSALFPPGHDEVLLQAGGMRPVEEVLGHPGTTVDEQQDRLGLIGRSQEQALHGSVDRDRRLLPDAVWSGAAVRTENRSGLAWAPPQDHAGEGHPHRRDDSDGSADEFLDPSAPGRRAALSPVIAGDLPEIQHRC